MSTTIEDRFILALREDDGSYGYWQGLEQSTGIASARWRKAYTRQQRPTTDMLQAIARQKPQYAFWLMTGITDAANGHTAPTTALTFPEMPLNHMRDQWAEDYFKESIELNDSLYKTYEGTYEVNPEDANRRFHETERRLMGSQWLGGELVSFAYELAAQIEYDKLMAWHEQRELHRKEKFKALKKAPKGMNVNKLGFVDPRTEHQSVNDLFWLSPSDSSKKNGD